MVAALRPLSKFVVNGSVERLLMAVVHAYVLQSRRLSSAAC